MFELAVVLLISLSVLIGAVGVGDLLLSSYQVSRVADLASYDHALTSLVLRDDGSIEVNESALRSGVERLIDRARIQLEETTSASAREYRIEVEVAVLDLSPRDGAVQRVLVRPSLSFRRGDLPISAELNQKTSLQKEFERLAGQPGSSSMYAFPLPGAPGAEEAYIPLAVLLGIRVFVSLENSPTAGALSTLGLVDHDMVFDWKVIPLRGEFGGV